jgi:hypothetical protein
MSDSSPHSTSRLVVGEVRHVKSEPADWKVYELRDRYDRRGTPSLIFESEMVVRRVRNYPPDWRSWDDESLLRLSETV